MKVATDHLSDLWKAEIEPLRREAPGYRLRQRDRVDLKRGARSYVAWALTSDGPPADEEDGGRKGRWQRALRQFEALWPGEETPDRPQIETDVDKLRPLIDQLGQLR